MKTNTEILEVNGLKSITESGHKNYCLFHVIFDGRQWICRITGLPIIHTRSLTAMFKSLRKHFLDVYVATR